MKRTLLFLLPTFAFLLSSCSSGPESVRPFVALGVANALEFVVPAAQKETVASQIHAAGDLYNELAGPAGIPSPAQFKVALDRFLPAGPSKAITETNLVAIYSVYYPDISGSVPQVQLDFLSQFLLGAKDGATPFLPPSS